MRGGHNMSSWNIIPQLKSLNQGNFVKRDYDSERREYVVKFRNNNIKIPEHCYRVNRYIYDVNEDIKVCRIEIIG